MSEWHDPKSFPVAEEEDTPPQHPLPDFWGRVEAFKLLNSSVMYTLEISTGSTVDQLIKTLKLVDAIENYLRTGEIPNADNFTL